MNNDQTLNAPAIPWANGWQPVKSFKDLTRTDMVRNKLHKGKTYVVTANYGDRVTAADTVDITNPEEWEVFR